MKGDTAPRPPPPPRHVGHGEPCWYAASGSVQPSHRREEEYRGDLVSLEDGERRWQTTHGPEDKRRRRMDS